MSTGYHSIEIVKEECELLCQPSTFRSPEVFLSSKTTMYFPASSKVADSLVNMCTLPSIFTIKPSSGDILRPSFNQLILTPGLESSQVKVNGWSSWIFWSFSGWMISVGISESVIINTADDRVSDCWWNLWYHEYYEIINYFITIIYLFFSNNVSINRYTVWWTSSSNMKCDSVFKLITLIPTRAFLACHPLPPPPLPWRNRNEISQNFSKKHRPTV